MPPNPPLPKAGSDQTGAQTAGTLVNSGNGWASLTHALSRTVPRHLNQARRATAGVHILIRTGR